jgi:hypothetical protein
MRRILGVLLLLLTAVDAYGDDVLLHYHNISYRSSRDLFPGSELTFTFKRDDNDLLSFRLVAPELPPDTSPIFPFVQNFYEPDAGSLGINWSELESVMASPPGMSTRFGYPGKFSTFSFALQLEGAGIDSYAKVDLNRIMVRYVKGSSDAAAVIEFYGEGLVAPEPSSAILSFICLSSLVSITRTRRRDVRCSQLALA